DSTRWRAVGGSNGALYEYLGAADTLDLSAQDYTDGSLWREITGAAGEIYIYMGEDDATYDLASADFGDLRLWKLDPETQLVAEGLNLSTSGSATIGAIVVLNQVDGAVEAFVADATVTAADRIDLQAIQSAVIRADTDSVSSSSGG